MANLIIKSSADNLVLQGSDASPAITVGATGTTTFAENATLSGTANNLGTATAGTLSSGVIFPAGHTMQMVQSVKQDSFSKVGTGETLVPGYDCSITPIKASSKILVHWNFDTCSSTSMTAYAYMERKIGSAAWAKLTGAMGTPSGTSNSAAISHAGGENDWEMHKRTGMFLDTPSYTLTDAVQYRIGINNESTSATLYVGITGRNNTIYHPVTASILILTEVSA
jgi:hypothetical protein